MQDLAYFKVGIRDLGVKIGRDSGLKLWTGHGNWQFYGLGFGKLLKVPRSKKAGDKNLQRESKCVILNDPDVTQNRSYPCFRASHSAFFLHCCFIVTSYSDIWSIRYLFSNFCRNRILVWSRFINYSLQPFSPVHTGTCTCTDGMVKETIHYGSIRIVNCFLW